MSIKVLINDPVDEDVILLFEEAGYEIHTDKIPQEELSQKIKPFNVVVVRSATEITAEVIENAPKLKVIGRAGVGLDNINLEKAESKGIEVINTPMASSQSVAELTIAHIYTLARNLHYSNREMPERGNSEFKQLKKKLSGTTEISGKTLGIVGMGNIGKKVCSLAMGNGMTVLPYDRSIVNAKISWEFKTAEHMGIYMEIPMVKSDELLANSDIITFHIPHNSDEALITDKHIDKMKDGVFIVNTARGGIISEKALLKGLNSGKIAGVALDVFENEPTPSKELLAHPKVALSPHIGGSTFQAKKNVGMELADKILAFFGDN